MRFFRFAASFIAIVAVAAPAYAATCAPSRLLHIVLTDVTPGVVPGSFAAQPKVFYRIGNGKLRIEEALDRRSDTQGLIVVAEPNVWMINLADKSGRHTVDPGPTFDAIAPVIAEQGVPAKLARLQLGCESDYLAAHAIAPTRTERIRGVTLTVYRITDGSDAIELLERQGTKTPAYARYYRQGKLDLVLRYDLYETVPNDPNLFEPPGGVRMTQTGGQ